MHTTNAPIGGRNRVHFSSLKPLVGFDGDSVLGSNVSEQDNFEVGSSVIGKGSYLPLIYHHEPQKPEELSAELLCFVRSTRF